MFRCLIVLPALLAIAHPGVGPACSAEPADEADRKTLAEAGISDDGEALLDYFRQRTVGDQERAEILGLIRQMGDERFDNRQSATARVVDYGQAAVGLLRAAQRGGDFEIAMRASHCLAQIEKVPSTALSPAVARRLAAHKPPGTAEVLLAYLPYADDEAASDEIRATLASVAVTNGQANPTLVEALRGGSPAGRGAAGEALVRGGAVDVLDDVRGLIGDPAAEPDTRARIAIALVTVANDRSAVPGMIRLMTDAPLERGWQVESILCRLAGDEERPEMTLGSDKDDRVACRDAWLKWWEVRGDALDLTPLADEPRLLGYTLVLQMDNSNSTGSVVELGADKKVRWRIDNLQFPIDVVPLPDDRFLIAEHNGHQISERDRQGRILWSHQVVMPVSVQRLADGNTFVAARNHLYIFDHDKKQVWDMPRTQHDIVCARYVPRDDGDQIIFVTNSGNCARVDRKTKKVLNEFSVGRVQYWSGLDLLPDNRVLLTQQNAVAEFDMETGKATGWEKAARGPTSVQRLLSGNTLINHMNENRVVEVDDAGKVKWEYRPTDARPWRAYRR